MHAVTAAVLCIDTMQVAVSVYAYVYVCAVVVDECRCVYVCHVMCVAGWTWLMMIVIHGVVMNDVVYVYV